MVGVLCSTTTIRTRYLLLDLHKSYFISRSQCVDRPRDLGSMLGPSDESRTCLLTRWTRRGHVWGANSSCCPPWLTSRRRRVSQTGKDPIITNWTNIRWHSLGPSGPSVRKDLRRYVLSAAEVPDSDLQTFSSSPPHLRKQRYSIVVGVMVRSYLSET